jgi:Large polyvalent protein associated domain 38/ADP-Ribosyltransferase in polyvalent proteins
MVCVYSFANGDVITGKPALKAYLTANLASLLPARAAKAPAFKRSPVQAATSPDVQAAIQRVEQVVANQTERWANSPRVIVAADMNDPRVPRAVREDEARQQAEAKARGEVLGDSRGFWHDGNVYLLAAHLPTDMDASRVLFHEGLGHLGLRGVFGEGLNAVLQQIVALRKAEVIAKAKSYGLDVTNEEDMLHAAEEVLASMAETTPQIGFVKRAIAAIRSWLRQNVRRLSDIELSDAEIIRSYILPARAFVEQGAQAGRAMAGKTAFSRAPGVQTDAFKRWFGDSKVVNAKGEPLVMYHGTDADIATFKPKDGMIFVTADPNFAEEYTTTTIDSLDKSGGQPNIIPVFVKAENPFDYENPEHFAALQQYEKDNRYTERSISHYVNDTKRGDYEAIESRKMQDAIKAMGHDGFYVREAGRQVKNLGVFRPEQIKSATGNNGNFDPANPDIRHNRAPAPATPADTGLTLPEPGLLRRVQATIQDNMNRVRQVQERIEKLVGSALPEYADYYGAEANRPGRIAARLEDFEKTMTAPLMKKLAKSGHTSEQLSELLHAQHAQERNEIVAKINPDMPDGGSGMTNAEAAAILARNRTNRELLDLAEEARAIAKATLELKLAYGLIDIETFDTLATVYKNYVPLKGDGEYGPKVKRAMGHDERDEHILENLARDYQQAVVAGEKNLARQSLLAMVLENPDPELWTVGVPPKGRYVAGTIFTITKGGTEVATFSSQAQVNAFLEAKGTQAGQYEVMVDGERVREFAKPLQDNEVMVYVDGKPVRIQINGDEHLARQLRPLDQGKMNPILEFMRGMNRYLSKIYTGYNPAFIIKNTARDAMTGTINILGNEGAGTALKAWANYPAAMKALSIYAAKGAVPTGDTGKMLQEYRQFGGKTGASYMSDLEEQGKTLQRMFDDAYGATGYLADGKPGKAALIAGRKIVGGMAHTIEVLNQATENGLRLALFMAMRQQGVSPGEAAQAAKSVTVDFDRKGSLTPALGAIFLFFNPAVQGTANALKTLVKGNHKAQAWTALGALAVLGAYAAGQGMDEDKDRWLGEGWESRSKNLILNVGNARIKVPLSMEFSPFYAFGLAMAEAKRGESKLKAAGHIVSSFLDAYFPLQGFYSSESDNHGLDAVSSVIPTVIKPAYQIATNRNSFGSQVVPDSELTKDRPDNLKMFKGTKGSAYDAAAQGIAAAGEALGAGRYENDITKVSPETLKMLWRTYTGGLGQFVTDAAGFANVAAQDGANVEASDMPIVKDFLKPNDVKPIRGRFYDLTKDARAAAEEFKQAKKAGDGEAMDKIMDKPEKAELLGLDRLIKSTTKAAGAIRDEMVDINGDKDLSLAEKRAKLKELEREEEAIYRDAIEAFR